MPSTKKTLYYISSALCIAVSVGLLGFGMSTKWATSNMLCGIAGFNIFNGSAKVNIALFNGRVNRDFCPLYGGTDDFSVIPTLNDIGGAANALHIVMVLLLVVCLLFSAGSILVSLYNSVGNPYETCMGPIGVYTCCSTSASLSVVVLILFVVSVNATSIAEDLVRYYANGDVDLKGTSVVMDVGFYMLIPYIALNLGAIALVYLYNHGAYTHKREQHRPTEDAPKEIMMY